MQSALVDNSVGAQPEEGIPPKPSAPPLHEVQLASPQPEPEPEPGGSSLEAERFALASEPAVGVAVPDTVHVQVGPISVGGYRDEKKPKATIKACLLGVQKTAVSLTVGPGIKVFKQPPKKFCSCATAPAQQELIHEWSRGSIQSVAASAERRLQVVVRSPMGSSAEPWGTAYEFATKRDDAQTVSMAWENLLLTGQREKTATR